MSSTPQHDPKQILGEYTIDQKLDSDSRSEHYLARQLDGEEVVRRVLVTQLRSPYNRDEKQKRALRKAVNRGRFSHPNVMEILNVISSPEEFLIVSEYSKGASLDEVLERSRSKGIPLSLGYVTRIVTAICDALDYAFTARGPDGSPRRICHGQVTPSNVWISMDGKVKVANFQVGIIMREMAPPSSSVYTGMFSYLSPEDAREGYRDLRSDIFSVGVILYEMTMGEPLFQRKSDEESLAAIMNDPIAPPSSIHPDYPASLELTLLRSISRDREERYATAAQLAQGVRRSLSGQTELANRTALATFMRMLFPERADRKTGVWQSPTYVGPSPIADPGGEMLGDNTPATGAPVVASQEIAFEPTEMPSYTGGESTSNPAIAPPRALSEAELHTLPGQPGQPARAPSEAAPPAPSPTPNPASARDASGPVPSAPVAPRPSAEISSPSIGAAEDSQERSHSGFERSSEPSLPLPPGPADDPVSSPSGINPSLIKSLHSAGENSSITGPSMVSEIKVFRTEPTSASMPAMQETPESGRSGWLIVLVAVALIVSAVFWLVIYPSL